MSDTRAEIGQLLDNLVQGVQEISSKPHGLDDKEGIAEGIKDYYDQRAKWINLIRDKIEALHKKKIREARIDELEDTLLYMPEHSEAEEIIENRIEQLKDSKGKE